MIDDPFQDIGKFSHYRKSYLLQVCEWIKGGPQPNPRLDEHDLKNVHPLVENPQLNESLLYLLELDKKVQAPVRNWDDFDEGEDERAFLERNRAYEEYEILRRLMAPDSYLAVAVGKRPGDRVD